MNFIRQRERALAVLGCVFFAGLLLRWQAEARTPSTAWEPLFNGHDLSGWTHVGPGRMVVLNNLLTTSGGMGLLYWNGGKVGNCTLRFVYRMKHFNDNSGVFIRIPIEPWEPQMPVWYAYEVQIDNHPEDSGENANHATGTLYSLTHPLAMPGRPGPQWNTMEITMLGEQTVVVVNGTTVTDYTEGQPVQPRHFDYEPIHGKRPNFGYFGIQNESAKSIVQFRSVELKRGK